MPVSPLQLPGLWGWDSSTSAWARTNYKDADVYNMSFVPVLKRPNYQDTGLSMRTSLFDESTYADIFLSNTLGASNIRSTMYDVRDPWNSYPFAVDMSGF